jgi:hypothetical protein
MKAFRLHTKESLEADNRLNYSLSAAQDEAEGDWEAAQHSQGGFRANHCADDYISRAACL